MTVAAIAALALVGCDEEAMHQALNLQHDLLTADFADETDDTFVSVENDDVRLGIHEGTYRMTVKQPLEVPISSYGWFSRTAYNVQIDVTVVHADSDDGVVGVMCLDGDKRPQNGYAFWISTPGDGYVLWKVTDGEYSEAIASIDRDVEPLRDGQRIGMRCIQGSIVGVLDGNVVVSSRDESFDRFNAVNLVWGSTAAGDFVQYDDLVAVVPE